MTDKIEKSILINAPREKVWEVVTKQPGLGTWMKEFASDSRVEGNWEMGEKLIFTGDSGEGMQNEVVELVPNEITKLKPTALLKDGAPDPTQDISAFSDTEDYIFSEENGKTKLEIKSFSPEPSLTEMFNDLWDKALNKIKELAETNNGKS